MTDQKTGAIPPTGGALSAYCASETTAMPVSLPPALRKPRLRRWEASEYLEVAHGLIVAPATLAKYASVGGGPAFNKGLGRTPLYPRGELDRWATERLGKLMRSTSDTGMEG